MAEAPWPRRQRVPEIEARRVLSPQAEQDYRAIRYCVERSHGSPLARSRFLKKLEKNWRQGRVMPSAGTGAWRKALCCARIMLGDYSRWDGWEYRSDYAANLWLNRPLPIPIWDGGPTRKLLVLAEEGIGDEVLFMSLLPEAIVRCGFNIVVECDARLRGILERSFRVQTVTRLVTLTHIREWARDQGFSAWILMGDLARYFRRDKSHFPGKPYLKPDPARVAEMERFRGRIGVSWSGNHGRYDPEQFIRGDWVNLQYDATHPRAQEPGIDLKADIEGLFALVSALSRVVSVSTSIAHIAGSIGTPVEVIHAPYASGGKNDQDILNWKWGAEGATPWYGSAKVFINLNHYVACGG